MKSHLLVGSKMFRLRTAYSQTNNVLNKNFIFNVIKYKSTKSPTSAEHAAAAAGATSADSNSLPPLDTSTTGYAPDGGIQAAKTGKLPARNPLAKNFFLGIVDKELLAFPEVISREDLSKLQNEILPIKGLFDSIDSHAIDATRTVPIDIVDNMRQLEVYGLNAPLENDGKGLGWSQSLLATESESKCPDVALSLLSHRVIVDTLNEVGTDEQKLRFLKKLAKGTMVATEAIYELEPSESEYFNTSAEHNVDSRSWTLDGEKSFVVTGPVPTGSSLLFLVIAQTHRANTRGDASRGTTVFLVDSASKGIQVGDKHFSFGCRGQQWSTVHFENVVVPDSCVLGEAHDGNRVAEKILRANRLRSSLIGFGMTENVVSELAQYFLDNKMCGMSLNEMELNRSHLSRAVCATYAMESMIYLTAGLLDEFHGQDVALEAAITKYYTLDHLFKLTSKYMDVMGPRTLLSGQTTEIDFRNAAQLCTQGESLDTLRLFIALTGLQHSGVLMNETIRMSRNPLFHPAHIFGKFLQTSNIDNPKTKMRLADNLHPSLEAAAQCIEHSVARLQMCTELLLTRHGSNIVEHHNEILRLTEMITNIYAMFCSVSRASRSYCIGLHLADHELLAASTICLHGHDLVKTLATEIFNGQYVNNDNNLHRLAKQVAKSKGRFAGHPLTYNF